VSGLLCSIVASLLFDATDLRRAKNLGVHCMNWVGYKVQLSETCDEGYPDLITQVGTTLATTSDFVMGAPIEQDLADRQLLPGTHLLD
jgi:hypothetical protein